MTTTSEQDRIPDGITFALTLTEVMADLDSGWDEWAPELAPTDVSAVLETSR